MSRALDLPPPPAPPGSIAVSRSPSALSSSSQSTVRGPAASASYAAQRVEEKEEEPTVDELTRELVSLSDLVTSISSNCLRLVDLRDSVLTLADAPLEQLQSLAALTTSTGSLVLALSSDLALASSRLAALEALVEKGEAAVLPSELAVLQETLQTVQFESAKGVERVRKLAWEELDARESARRRLEERVRRENVQIGEEGVEMAVRQAFVGAERRVAELDLQSYAGRVAAEAPFTELATLIDSAKEDASQPGGLSRTSTRLSTATTLVGSAYASDPYSKLAAASDDEEQQPLAPGGGSGGLVGDLEKGVVKEGEGKMGRWRKLRVYWKDYLVRLGTVLGVVAVIVGIIVWVTLAQRKEDDEDASSSSTAAAAASST